MSTDGSSNSPASRFSFQFVPVLSRAAEGEIVPRERLEEELADAESRIKELLATKKPQSNVQLGCLFLPSIRR
jgi:hypothetical protein